MSRRVRHSRWPKSVLALAVSLALAGSACSSQNKANYALAGVAIAAAVTEAAVQRAVTGSCWGQCEYGTRCDEKAGLCVPIESWTGPAPPPPLPSASAGTPEPDDSCAGYCLEDERCVLVPNGDVDCVPKTAGDRTPKPAP